MKKYLFIFTTTIVLLLSACNSDVYTITIQDLDNIIVFDVDSELQSITFIPNPDLGYELDKIVEINNKGEIITDGKEINLDGTFDFYWDNTENISFKTIYTPIKIEIVLHLEGGNLRNDNLSLTFEVYYGDELPDIINYDNLSLPGYYFEGWYSMRSGLGEKYANKDDWEDKFVYLNRNTFSDFFENTQINENGEYVLNLYAYWIK